MFDYAEYQVNWLREKNLNLERSINEDKLNKVCIISNKRCIEYRDVKKEKGIQTRSNVEIKLMEEKIKIENEKEKALRKMLRLKEITITQKERTITQQG